MISKQELFAKFPQLPEETKEAVYMQSDMSIGCGTDGIITNYRQKVFDEFTSRCERLLKP